MDINVEDQVRVRAFQLWECEGMVAGRDLEYWVAAESEVKSKLTSDPAPAKPKRARTAKAKK